MKDFNEQRKITLYRAYVLDYLFNDIDTNMNNPLVSYDVFVKQLKKIEKSVIIKENIKNRGFL